MLKIKDNIDLKELEKLDFEFKLNEYFSSPYYVSLHGNVLIWKNSKKLEIIHVTHINDEYDILFDLIQAGLVEKV